MHPVDLGTMLAVALAPSALALAAGICRATWVWFREQADPQRSTQSLDRLRI